MSASTPPLARSLAESLDHTCHGHSMLITNETLRPVQGSKAPFSLWEEFSDKCKDTSFASKIQSAYPPKTIKYHDRALKKPKQPHFSMYPSWTYDNYQYQAVGKCCALKGVILHIFNILQRCSMWPELHWIVQAKCGARREVARSQRRDSSKILPLNAWWSANTWPILGYISSIPFLLVWLAY